MKDMFEAKDTKVLFEKILNKLSHENDGLIYTKECCPYYPGTCKDILKWKPKHLNTIDFLLY
jgi:mRNA guanylyltransferase